MLMYSKHRILKQQTQQIQDNVILQVEDVPFMSIPGIWQLETQLRFRKRETI